MFLIVVGAATMLLAAGPLAASQPGFTIIDPLSASLLDVFLFSEHIRTGVLDVADETAALAVVVIAGLLALSHSHSHSHLIVGQDGTSPGPSAGYQGQSLGERGLR